MSIHRKLQDAAGIAKAAEVCAETGNVQIALKMAMDIEDPAHQANRMLNAALLVYNDLLNEGPLAFMSRADETCLTLTVREPDISR